MDAYLSRSLKNWVERQKSHARSKESLLRLAAVQPDPGIKAAGRALRTNSDYTFQQHWTGSPGVYFRGSFTLSLAWPMDLTSLLRPVC